jgi:hypothetical protein
MRVMIAHCQIKPSKRFSSNHTRRNGSDAHDAAKCAKESADVQGSNVYADTTFATTAQDPFTLVMAAPSLNTAPD